jgi:hypothetical protein
MFNFAESTDGQIMAHLDKLFETHCAKEKKITTHLAIRIGSLRVELELERKSHHRVIGGIGLGSDNPQAYSRANVWTNRVSQQSRVTARIIKVVTRGKPAAQPMADPAFDVLASRTKFGQGTKAILTIHELCQLLRDCEEIGKAIIFL